jgi:hypothetical protein
MTSLTVYGTSTASASTLTTANILVTGTGAASTTVGTRCGSGFQTAWGELHSQAFATAWPVSGAIGAASGHGWILDATTLEGQLIAAGNWTPTLNLRYLSANGTATADIHVRAFKRSSGGTYTQIGTDMVLAAQAITSATAQYTFAATSEAAMSFSVGDKLYIDIWLNITANANTVSNSQMNVTIASSATQGVANDCQIVTPGYSSNTTTSTRTVPASAALKTTNTRTVSDTVALKTTNTRTIGASAALKTTNTRTITPASAALKTTTTRTITVSAAIEQTSARVIGATAALKTTQARTVPTSAALKQTSTRTIGAQAALKTTNKRTVGASAALANARTVPCSASLSMTFNANAMLLAPSGQTTLLVPSGQTNLIVPSGQTTLII